jgi:hypothetical protein
MGMTDEFVSAHFHYFDKSCKEHAGIREFIESVPDAPRNGFYFCPLCLNNFLIAVGNQLRSSAKFTKDHFRPKSAGGHHTLLVCESCNSTAGSEFDYILEEFLKMCAFNKRIPNAALEMTHAVSAIEGHWRGHVIANDTGTLDIQLKKNPKKPIEKLDNWIERSKTDLDYSITMTIQDPQPKIVGRALLKAAYLYCFCHWGYEFAHSTQGYQIRQVLDGLLEYPVENGRLFMEDEGKGLPEGPAFIQAPAAWRGLVVNIPLELKNPSYKCMVTVPIPAPTLTGWDDLKNLSWPSTNEPLTVTMQPLPNYLHQSELYGYTRTWGDFNPK